jgi:hypothetical protein
VTDVRGGEGTRKTRGVGTSSGFRNLNCRVGGRTTMRFRNGRAIGTAVRTYSVESRCERLFYKSHEVMSIRNFLDRSFQVSKWSN